MVHCVLYGQGGAARGGREWESAQMKCWEDIGGWFENIFDWIGGVFDDLVAWITDYYF